MRPAQPFTRRRAARGARWLAIRCLAATAAGLTALALTFTTIAPAEAAAGWLAPGVLGVLQPISLNTANWTGSAGFESRAPAWYTDGSGVVHLQGAVSQASASGPGANLIGTLPAGAAPPYTVYTIVHTYLGTYADLAIEPSGQLALIDPRAPMVKDYSFVSLEGITYRR